MTQLDYVEKRAKELFKEFTTDAKHQGVTLFTYMNRRDRNDETFIDYVVGVPESSVGSTYILYGLITERIVELSK